MKKNNIRVAWIESYSPFRLRIEVPTKQQFGEGDLVTGFKIDLPDGAWGYDDPRETSADWSLRIGQTRIPEEPEGTNYPFAVFDCTNPDQLARVLNSACMEAEDTTPLQLSA